LDVSDGIGKNQWRQREFINKLKCDITVQCQLKFGARPPYSEPTPHQLGSLGERCKLHPHHKCIRWGNVRDGFWEDRLLSTVLC